MEQSLPSLPFPQKFSQQGQQLGEQILMMIPELESVVIVPVWTVAQPTPQVSSGLVVTRVQPGPGTTMSAIRQLLNCLQGQQQQLLQRILEIDDGARIMAHEIYTKQQRIKELDQEIASKEARAYPLPE